MTLLLHFLIFKQQNNLHTQYECTHHQNLATICSTVYDGTAIFMCSSFSKFVLVEIYILIF